MNLFDDIIKEFPRLEEKQETIVSIARNKGFQDVDTLKRADSFAGDGNYYEIFRAVLEEGNFKLVAKVETKDKYRSFVGNDDEPYCSTLELWENGKKVKEKSYAFWK
ncbi:hypothetical protein [Lysinibacillus capsici]|uniref:hypothetical protein n=1 Tax=Lysinibacillus capsici TaxID=2115968 RepID=UPI00279A38B2|nr:hypothetical protein QIX46_23660 [Lysinibacillus boronitolerans]